jgi:hypothetical protein
LCRGSGGWAAGFLAEGWDVLGFDTQPQPLYPGKFQLGDVRVVARDVAERHMSGWYGRIKAATLIVASPPCEEFSRHQMPWTKRRNPPQPDLSIAEACWSIARDTGVPIVLENVRMAQKWFGPARWHGTGSFYLWGDVPALMPVVIHRSKENYSSQARLERARVPLELAQWIARCFAPVNSAGTEFPDELGRYGCPNCEGEGLI